MRTDTFQPPPSPTSNDKSTNSDRDIYNDRHTYGSKGISMVNVRAQRDLNLRTDVPTGADSMETFGLFTPWESRTIYMPIRCNGHTHTDGQAEQEGNEGCFGLTCSVFTYSNPYTLLDLLSDNEKAHVITHVQEQSAYVHKPSPIAVVFAEGESVDVVLP